jgi:hypothetical protein
MKHRHNARAFSSDIFRHAIMIFFLGDVRWIRGNHDTDIKANWKSLDADA